MTAIITQKVKEIMEYKLGLDHSQLLESASFVNDLGIDSLDVLELQMELEKEFNITIPPESAEKLFTVGAVIDYISLAVSP
jgi:acyl carrier protein